MGDYSAGELSRLIDQIGDPTKRNATAAALSKVAAKAEGACAHVAMAWLWRRARRAAWPTLLVARASLHASHRLAPQPVHQAHRLSPLAFKPRALR